MDIASRNAEIAAAIGRNVPRGLLADQYGLSTTRIGQIAKDLGAPLRRSPRRFAQTNWPDADVATLKRMWGKRGTRVADIARALGRTRNAVIGKARRLGMARLQAPTRGPDARRKEAS